MVPSVSLAVGSQGNHNSWRARVAKEPYILGVCGQPRNVISWRVLAAKDCDLLGGCYIFLALWRFCCCSSLLGGHIAKEIILGGQQPR